MNFAEELIWGRYALNQNKINREQLQECIEAQGKLREHGVNKPLSEIMLAKRMIDKKTLEQITKLEGLIPGYQMVEVLGSGGVGIVYKAYSEKYQRHVAIKVLNPEYTDNSLVLNRFLREIDISQTLSHPNIVKGYDSGRVDDLYYMVLEYLDGSNLGEYIKDNGVLNERETLEVAKEIVAALSYAWKHGLTHRDIKPQNIIITNQGAIKVCDFGLAKLADTNIALTLSGTIVGSPYYISPEQVSSASSIDYRADIYSLGASLYYLICGRVLFDEKTTIAFCSAHVNQIPTPPSNYAKVSRAFDLFIMKSLEKNPERRTSSIEAYEKTLTKLLENARKSKGAQQSLRIKIQSMTDGDTRVDGNLQTEEESSSGIILSTRKLPNIVAQQKGSLEPTPPIGIPKKNVGKATISRLDFDRMLSTTLQIAQSSKGVFQKLFKATSNQYDQVRLIWKKWRKDSNIAENHYELGVHYEKKGKIKKAIDEYAKAIEFYPEFCEAHNKMGAAYQKLKRYQESISAYEIAISIRPNYAEAHYNLGNVYYEKGDVNRAIEEYEMAIDCKPNYALAYNNLGNIYYKQRKISKAIEFYQKAITHKSNYAEAHFNLGLTYRKQWTIPKAIHHYQKAVQLKPDYTAAYYNLGEAYKHQRNYNKAIEHFRKYLELAPKASDASKIKQWIEQVEKTGGTSTKNTAKKTRSSKGRSGK